MKTATARPASTQTDLLIDAVFTIRARPSDTDVRRVSLPGLLAAASTHPDLVLASMRPHQEHAVLATLVYLAAACGKEPHGDEAVYREDLLALAQGTREAYCLYVEDIGKPAWMQSPGIPPRSKEPLATSGRLYSPAALDVFFTLDSFGPAKHHVRDADEESWIFALISQQSQAIPAASSGTTARGSRGRLGLSVVPSLGFGARFQRFVRIGLEHRARIVGQYGYKKKDGAVLLWLRPFVSGGDSYKASELDPFFLDDSAKIRLFRHGGALYARRFTFEPQPGEQKVQRKFRRVALPLGVSGDLWTPVVVRKHGKPLDHYAAYVAAAEKEDLSGPFSYDRVVQLLFGRDCDLPPAFTDRDGIESGYILLQGVGVPKRAGTTGWQERAIPITASTLRALEGDTAGAFADVHLKIAGRGAEILTDAMMTMFHGERLMHQKVPVPMMRGYLVDYHRRIDRAFFDSLVARIDGAPLTDWIDHVLSVMREVFEQAKSLIPQGQTVSAYVLGREVLNQPFVETKRDPKGRKGSRAHPASEVSAS
jgi:hypothetical protein